MHYNTLNKIFMRCLL